jgi:hypothetical protein
MIAVGQRYQNPASCSRCFLHHHSPPLANVKTYGFRFMSGLFHFSFQNSLAQVSWLLFWAKILNDEVVLSPLYDFIKHTNEQFIDQRGANDVSCPKVLIPHQDVVSFAPNTYRCWFMICQQNALTGDLLITSEKKDNLQNVRSESAFPAFIWKTPQQPQQPHLLYPINILLCTQIKNDPAFFTCVWEHLFRVKIRCVYVATSSNVIKMAHEEELWKESDGRFNTYIEKTGDYT